MNEPRNEERITFRTTAQMCRELTQLSDRQGVSVAEIIREVLRAYLARQ